MQNAISVCGNSLMVLLGDDSGAKYSTSPLMSFQMLLQTVSARRLAGEAGPGPERRLFRRAGLTVQRQQEQQQAGPGRMFSPLFSQSASGQPGGESESFETIADQTKSL